MGRGKFSSRTIRIIPALCQAEKILGVATVDRREQLQELIQRVAVIKRVKQRLSGDAARPKDKRASQQSWIGLNWTATKSHRENDLIRTT